MKNHPTYQLATGAFKDHETAVVMWKIFLNRIEDTYIMHGDGAPDLEERRNNHQWMGGSPDDAWVEKQLNRLSSFQAGPSSSGASSQAGPSPSGASSSHATPGSTGATTQSAGGAARPGPALASTPSGGAALSTNQASPTAGDSSDSEWKEVTKRRR